MNQPLGRPKLSKLIQAGGFIVLTGELTSCDRMMAMEIFEALGLDVSGSISSRTAFLLCGANPQQRKIDRAAELSVPVFTESEFWAAVDELHPAE
mgnify:CR=1 FL=1